MAVNVVRSVLLVACVLVLGLYAALVVTTSEPQRPPNSIASSRLAELATNQARQDVDFRIMRVTCPHGTLALGSAIICQAEYRKRVQPLNVKLRANVDGEFYVAVRAE